jgi:hypothetical protein
MTTHLPDQRFDTTSTTVDLVESYLANDFGTVLSTHYHQCMLAEKKEKKKIFFFLVRVNLLPKLLHLLDLAGKLLGKSLLQGLTP